MTVGLPNPSLAFRVGVSGHRSGSLRLPASVIPTLEERLSLVFSLISAAVQEVSEQHPHAFRGACSEISLLTELAEGVDQAAARVIPANWQLRALFPFPESVYEAEIRRNAPEGYDISEFRSLAKASAVKCELPPLHSDAPDSRAYEYANNLLLNNVDLLIGVWDGNPEHGPGGTGHVVRQALKRSIPVLWIHSTNPQNVVLLRGDGARLIADEGLGWENDLRKHVSGTLISTASIPPVRAAARMKRNPAPRDLLSFLQGVPLNAEDLDRIQKVVVPRIIASDALATYAGRRYRAASAAVYFFSAAAVVIASLAAFIHAHIDAASTSFWLKGAMVACELLCIGAAIFVVQGGNRQGWQDEWLAMRGLSEGLRETVLMSLIGRGASANTLPHNFDAYVLATQRELPLPGVLLDKTYLLELLTRLKITIIRDQITYHTAALKKYQRRDATLSAIALLCFYLTLVALIMFVASWGIVAGYVLTEHVALGQLAEVTTTSVLEKTIRSTFMYLARSQDWLAFLCAVLPATGAALTGIRESGSYRELAERTAETLRELRVICEKSHDDLDTLGLISVYKQAVGHMAGHFSTWRSLTSRRKLSLA